MSNRSLIYSVHHADPTLRDLGEHNYTVPLIHYLLVGFGSRVVSSSIWNDGHAVQGDATEARALVLRFLDWFEPLAPDARTACADARRALADPRHHGEAYRLEAGDLYAMERTSTADAAAKDAETALGIVGEVTALLTTPGATLADGQHWVVSDALGGWQQDMGLLFSNVLSFHLG